MKISYIFYEKDYFKSLSILWNETLNNKSIKTSYSLIKWFAFKNAGYLFIAIDESNNKVVGSRGAWNWSFLFKQKKINAIQFGLTAVSEKCRRKGIFSSLNTKFINTIDKKKIDFIYNVSLQNAKKGYEKLGWKYFDSMKRITKVSLFSLFFNKKNDFKITNKIDDEIIRIFNKINKNRKTYTSKLLPNHDITFLLKRLSHKNDYKLLYNENIIIIYKVKKNYNLNNVFIGEVYHDYIDDRLLKRAFNQLHKNEKSIFINTYITKSHPNNTLYEKCKFRMLKKEYLSLGVKLLNDNLNFNEVKNNIVLSYLDLDTF